MPYVPMPFDSSKCCARVDPATYCPMLYDDYEDEWSEDAPAGLLEIRTSEVEFGEDLTDGVLAIDGARALLNKTMKGLKEIKFLDIKDALSTLLSDWRNYIKRKLQYFINMLVFPMVGCHKEKIRIHFEGCWLEPREFTVNVKPKERRGVNKDSNYFFR